MNPVFFAYATLAAAIVAEVAGSAMLQLSEGFTSLVPTVAMGVLYLISFFCVALTLKVIPLGLAYAIWAGLGIVLTALVGVVFFRQTLDMAAIVGIAMIVGGVLVMNLLSKSAVH